MSKSVAFVAVSCVLFGVGMVASSTASANLPGGGIGCKIEYRQCIAAGNNPAECAADYQECIHPPGSGFKASIRDTPFTVTPKHDSVSH